MAVNMTSRLRRRIHTTRQGFALALLVALLSLAGTAAGQVALRPADVEVPDIVGMPVDQALAALTGVELQADEMGQEYSDLDRGLVTRQDPLAGSWIPEGSTVRFWVSSGPEPQPPPPRLPWHWILGGVLLLAVLGLVARRRRRRRPGGRDVEVISKSDPGEQLIETSGRLDLGVEIELRAVRDPGEQEVETDGPLIRD